MKNFQTIAGLITLCVLSGVVRADVKVGDKPPLHFKAFNSQNTIDLADLKGKIVVVDFWATWCGPCMGEASHMVAVNQKYADKGLQFIGISLDEDPSALKKVIAEKNFTWPMSFEGKGWEGTFPKSWGVNGIPQTFIIGPDGEVLWRGHPAQIDEPLATAFKEHPPQLVDPKILEQAKTALEQANTQLADQQPAKAMKSLAGIPPEAKADADFAAKLAETTTKLLEYGNAQLTSIDPLIDSQQYTAAIQKLRDLSAVFTGTPVSVSAKKKLNELGSNPKVKQQLEAEKTEKESADALAVANQLKADKKDELAYPRFKAIVKTYPNTPAAVEAADDVKAYEANIPLMTKLTQSTNGKKAQAMLALAENYKSTGNTDKAKSKYQDVIDQFPGSSWAETAKKALEAMNE
jgi:thiol-disulfide isomerase/thioredoxin/outer membrane protein assembly factor BamD (BamD/ComL family)